MFNQLNNSTQLYKIQSQAGGEFNVAEVSFENMVDYDQIVFHDSAVLLHSDDKCSIRIHDFLHPFLLWGLTEISLWTPWKSKPSLSPQKKFFSFGTRVEILSPSKSTLPNRPDILKFIKKTCIFNLNLEHFCFLFEFNNLIKCFFTFKYTCMTFLIEVDPVTLPDVDRKYQLYWFRQLLCASDIEGWVRIRSRILWMDALNNNDSSFSVIYISSSND